MDSLALSPGLFFHTYAPEDDGVLGYQGQVLSMQGAYVRAQLFSWKSGQPADVAIFTRHFLKKHCKVYADRAIWRAAGEREMAETAYWRRWNRTRKPVAGITPDRNTET